MGWERKRGALLELSRMLRGRRSGLEVRAGSRKALQNIKYVITLDSDTSLNVGAARELGLEGKVDVRLKPRKSPYMQSFALEEDHRLVRTLQAQFRAVTGEDLPCAYDASVCDSNILAVTLGIPTVTFGPSGGNMHGDNEYGYAWQVKNCGEIYRRTVAELLNNEE